MNSVQEAVLARLRDPSQTFSPDFTADRGDGVSAPQCYGLSGYGDGYSYPGRCHRRSCPAADGCYIDLRDVVEALHRDEADEYESRRQVLREEGLDSNQIVAALSRQGFPPPTQETYLLNVRRGQLASGGWHECADDSCDTLILKSFGPLCGQHKPREEDDGDGPTRHGRELQAGAPVGPCDGGTDDGTPAREPAHKP